MLGSLAIASLLFAAASDEDEPETLVKFRLLRALGDLEGAYKALFSAADAPSRVMVLEGLLKSIVVAKDIHEATRRMNELLIAGSVYDEDNGFSTTTAYDFLKRTYVDRRGNPLYFPGDDGSVRRGVPGQLFAYSPIFFITSPNYGAYSRIWGAEGDLRIVETRMPGMAAVPGLGEFVVLHEDELEPCTVLPVSATVDPTSDGYCVDVVVQIRGIPDDDGGNEPHEKTFQLLRDGNAFLFMDGGDADWLADRITEGSSVESLTKNDILTKEVEEAAWKALGVSRD